MPTKSQEIKGDHPVDQALSTAPLLQVDGAVGFALADGFARFNFYQDRLTIDPANLEQDMITRVVCARMVMSVPAARRLQKWLGDAISGVEAKEGKDLVTADVQIDDSDV